MNQSLAHAVIREWKTLKGVASGENFRSLRHALEGVSVLLSLSSLCSLASVI